MPCRIDARALLATAMVLGLATSCSKPVLHDADVGHHRVRFVLPRGWEHLDHGRQQLFRNGEAQISLVDLGAGRALMDGTRGLDEATPEQLLEYVLTIATDQRDREVVVRKQRMIHGHEWTEVDTWNRVSHQDRLRIAYLDDDGYLLALAMDRGPIEQMGLVFETLLASFEVTPAPH